jgi:hypothetical protein
LMLSTLRAGRLLARRQSQLCQPQARFLWNISLPVFQGPGGVHVTKYNIVRNGKDGVEYDDFLIALPEREQLAHFSKETPLFLRYLKVVTDQEGRGDDFKAFYDRAKSGLTVESDVFITTEELLALMWKNGYSEQEKNAIQFTFPHDYKFHYPELSVLFNLSEEDTYKFCMRTRTEKSHIGELDWGKVKRKGFIRDHWLIFGTGVVIFKFFPFFNYYFPIKVFGTSMWVWTMWMLMNRWLATTYRRNEYMASQKTAQEVMEGEDAIVDAMKRFGNDAKCVEDLQGFKDETEQKIADYKKSLLLQMKNVLNERAQKQLQNIASFENNMGSALQHLVVKEAASSFKEKFPSSVEMQDQAFASAIDNLGGKATSSVDPVAKHFESSFQNLASANLTSLKGNATGTLPERVAFAQQLKEQEFQEAFMVSKTEVDQIKTMVTKVGTNFDFGKLSREESKSLDNLYNSVYQKVGFASFNLQPKEISQSIDDATKKYVDGVNSSVLRINEEVRTAKLKAFVQSFA